MNDFRDLVRQARPLILAHRGDSSHAPENTLEAAIRGHRSGADAWELDVRLTRDEVPVVIHDATLIRTTDVRRRFAGDDRGLDDFRVADFTWDELQTLDAGSWFVDPIGGHRSAAKFGTLAALSGADLALFTSGGLRIPSLADALALTNDLDWRVNVELKTFPEGNAEATVRKVVELIRSMDLGRRVLISSFRHDDLRDLSQVLPDVATGVLTGTPLHQPARYVREWVGADFYHPSADVLGSESDAYRHRPLAQSLGDTGFSPGEIPTLVYTVNDDQLAAHLAEIGVAGLFTDDPARLIRRD